MRNTSKENEQLVKTGKPIGGTQRIKKMMAGETDEDGKRDQKQRQEANEEKKNLASNCDNQQKTGSGYNRSTRSTQMRFKVFMFPRRTHPCILDQASSVLST